MSANGSEPPQEVVDEDGSVDRAVKKRIIQAREHVDETELALYRDASIDPDINLNEVQKAHIYGTTVKQFLRRIEPLLRTGVIEGNEDYYEAREIDTITLVPPDTDGYRFSLVADDTRPDRELRQLIGLPRNVDLLEPQTTTFTGLKSVIEEDTILAHQWEVCVKRDGAPPNWEYAYPAAQRAVPKSVYEEAMRVADMFLQNIGLGLEMEMEPYTGGTEPGL